MATCDVCGNDYWMAFEIRTVSGESHWFDSFECAMEKLAPRCEHCNCRIVGHGVEVEGRFYCCAHCARTVAELGNQIRDAVGVRPV
jgi:phage terminase large subunit GpA-like protein